MSTRINVGSYRFDYPYDRSKEHPIYTDDAGGMRCVTIEKHVNGFYIIHIYGWCRDARFTSGERGAWYETIVHLSPEELSGVSDGLTKYIALARGA